MKWFYEWRYKRHMFKSIKYQDPKFTTLFNIHIEKMRYYWEKLSRSSTKL